MRTLPPIPTVPSSGWERSAVTILESVPTGPTGQTGPLLPGQSGQVGWNTLPSPGLTCAGPTVGNEDPQRPRLLAVPCRSGGPSAARGRPMHRRAVDGAAAAVGCSGSFRALLAGWEYVRCRTRSLIWVLAGRGCAPLRKVPASSRRVMDAGLKPASKPDALHEPRQYPDRPQDVRSHRVVRGQHPSSPH